MTRVLLIVVLTALTFGARSFAPDESLVSFVGGPAMACGFVLLAGFLLGGIFGDIGLPRLTGYLLAGAGAGPHALDLISADTIERLRLFNGLAISLIALTAGCELELRAMKPLMRTIRWITLIAVLGGVVALAVTAYLMRGRLPFLDGLAPEQAAAVALVLGVAMAAQSPAVVVALRDEMRAEGPLTRTVLGVVVISDLVIIILFAAASGLAQRSLGASSGAAESPAGEILGSLAVGVLLGALIGVYLKLVSGSAGLAAVVAGFLVAEVGQRVGLDPLLAALAAGVFVRNATSLGDRLREAVDSAALPVYVAFFGFAGAAVHFDAMLAMAGPILVFVGVRAAVFVVGANLAGRVAGAPRAVRRYAGAGLLPQAGLALALAALFARAFPQLGAGAAALIFGVVAANELAAPLAYRWALARSGEAGRRPARKSASGESRDPAAPPLSAVDPP